MNILIHFFLLCFIVAQVSIKANDVIESDSIVSQVSADHSAEGIEIKGQKYCKPTFHPTPKSNRLYKPTLCPTKYKILYKPTFKPTCKKPTCKRPTPKPTNKCKTKKPTHYPTSYPTECTQFDDHNQDDDHSADDDSHSDDDQSHGDDEN
jgi:hypothetical protein